MISEIDKLANILQVTRMQLSNALARSAELEASLMELQQENDSRS